MSIKANYLLGEDHPEPYSFRVEGIGDTLALALSAFVTRDDDTQKFANNEDAVGMVRIPEHDVLIAMVADAHGGYVASHEAVQRFQQHVSKQGIRSGMPEAEIKQKTLDAVLDLSEDVLQKVQNSAVTYPPKSHHPPGTTSFRDMSETTFYAVLKVGTGYYAIGTGKSQLGVVRGRELNSVKTLCGYFMGCVPLRYKINEAHPEYQRAADEYLAVRKSGDAETIETARQKREETYTRRTLHYDDNHVRTLLPVHKLDVFPGDVLVLCTDGYDLRSEELTTRLVYAVRTIPLSRGMNVLFATLHDPESRKQIYDNVAIAALRV